MGRWSGKKVAVLYGGRSAEREVSLKTGEACAEALRSRGLDVTLVDAGLDLDVRLRALGADVAFLALHGRWGEDGCTQGLLESMGIPYTGSGVLASAAAMDKVVSKQLFRGAGLALAAFRAFPPEKVGSLTVADLPAGLPAVVKPACEGSSVGVHVVKTAGELPAALADAARFKGDVIVEQYVKGQEVNVAILDGVALGTVEMVPSREFYDYVAKYTPGSTTYHVPARLSPELGARVCRDAETAYRALGCSGVARVDFIVTPDGIPCILEVNTLPGMTGTSLVPKIAAGKGISFPEICERLLDGASLKG
jgi:D-alanine-D-alanine ligase